MTTGSIAIPCMLPIPAAGIIPQSVPIVPAVSVMDSDGDAAACGVVAVVALEAGGAALVLLAVLAQAVAVSATAAAIITRPVGPKQGRQASVARIVSPGQGTGRRQGWRKRISPLTVVTRRRAGSGLPGQQSLPAAAANYRCGNQRRGPTASGQGSDRADAGRGPADIDRGGGPRGPGRLQGGLRSGRPGGVWRGARR